MYHLDVNRAHREKSRWERHKNATCCFKQILEATPPQNCSCIATYLPSHKPFNKTRYAGHCWRSKDDIISDVLL